MPAQFESGFSLREVPWHGLGTILDSPPTAAEAIIAAGLDWEVQLRPVYAFKPTDAGGLLDEQGVRGDMEEIVGSKAVTRDKDERILGVVGSRFRPLQNLDAFKFFDFLVEQGAFDYETAGSLYDGKKVWVMAGLRDGAAEVVPGDAIRPFVLLTHAHDGSQSVEVYNTDIRVVCANTEYAARATGDLMGGIRHTGNVAERVEALKDAVAARHAVFAESMERYRFLASKRFAGDERAMRLFVRVLLGTKPSEVEEAEREGKPLPRGGAEIVRLYTAGSGNDMNGVSGTHWAAFNAVTEYIDHARGTGSKADNALSRRVASAWFGQGAQLKAKALEMLTRTAIAA